MTAACAACGYDASAVVAKSWSLFVELDAKSANARLTNSGATRWSYAADRNAWIRRLQIATADLGEFTGGRLRSATGFRRLTLTRHYYGKQRAFDPDNAVAGAKSCLDAAVRCGLLVDDSAKHAQVIYKQMRTTPTGVTFLVEELA